MWSANHLIGDERGVLGFLRAQLERADLRLPQGWLLHLRHSSGPIDLSAPAKRPEVSVAWAVVPRQEDCTGIIKKRLVEYCRPNTVALDLGTGEEHNYDG